MSEHELLLVQVGDVLSKVARPYSCDDVLPVDVRAALWQLGFQCNDETPREEVIARLWAKKRSLLSTMHPGWDGPGVTPPAAA
jgi:hypothetical protein